MKREIQNLLSSINVFFEGNDCTTIQTYCTSIGTGYDLRVHTLRKGWIKVEAKFLTKKIFHSWIIRDWTTRDADIFVVNNKWLIPYNEREYIKSLGCKIMDTYQFYRYIVKMNKRVTRFILNLMKNRDKRNIIEIDKVKESCTDERKCFETTFLSSENAHRINHSIDRSREGRNIIQVFKEEIQIRERESTPDEFLSYHLKRMNEIWEEIKRKEKLDWKGIRHKYYRKRGYFPDWYDYHKYLILKPSKTIFCSTRCYKFERCEKIKILGYYRWLVGELIKRGLLPKSHDDDFRSYYYDLKVRKRDYDSYNLEMMRKLETLMSKVSFWLSFKIPMCIYAMENIVLPTIEEKRRKRREKRRRSRTNGELDKWIRGNKS